MSNLKRPWCLYIVRCADGSFYTGITNDLERANSLIEQGASFRQARHHVYSRAGSPCYRCGSVINRSQGSGVFG